MQVGDHRAGRGSRDGAVVSAVTRWFSIDEDGQPQLPGWYDNRYRDVEEGCPERGWWDGAQWLWGPGGPPTYFGNRDTAGEFWRGLAEKPK